MSSESGRLQVAGIDFPLPQDDVEYPVEKCECCDQEYIVNLMTRIPGVWRSITFRGKRCCSRRCMVHLVLNDLGKTPARGWSHD